MCGKCLGVDDDDDVEINQQNSFVRVMSKDEDNDDHKPMSNDTQKCYKPNCYKPEIIPAVTKKVKKPMAGSTTIKSEYPITLKKEEVWNLPKVVWASLPSSSIQVRGPNYNKSRTKCASPQSLYELVQLDAIQSESTYFDLGQKYEMSHLLQKNNNKTWLAPSFLIISWLLPISPPKFGQKANEKGYIVTGYFKLRNETKEILQIITDPKYKYNEEAQRRQLNKVLAATPEWKQRINGVKLWEKWCKVAPHDPDMQRRLKFIPRGDNLAEMGVANYILKYNGKPTTIKKPGVTNLVFSHAQEDWMEIDVNMHPYPFVFKQAISHLDQHYFKDLLKTFAFVIEGRDVDELPEVLLGNPIRLVYVKRKNIVMAKNIFDK